MNVINKTFLLLYLTIGFLPYFGSIDKAPTQFFYLSILNLIVLIYLISLKKEFLKYFKKIFFQLPTILLFALPFWSLITYKVAINKEEVFIYATKAFIYFVSFLIIYLLVEIDKIKFKWISIAITSILIIEVTLVLVKYYERYGVVSTRDMGLRAYTGNINITGISILLKTPFLFYSLIKQLFPKKINFLLYPILTATIFTVTILGSKLSNLIIIGLILGLCTSFFLIDKNLKKYIGKILIFTLLPLLINLYVFKSNEVINVIDRTANFQSNSTSERLRFYDQAFNSIITNPILGIGAGNWKINSLLFEKDFLVDYVVPINVHNDFLETFAEIGLVGFILKYFIYIITIIYVVKFLRNYKLNTEHYILICSTIIFFLDSAINFPFQRPIIYIYHFIIIVFLFKAINFKDNTITKYKNKTYKILFLFVILLLSGIAVFSSYLVFDSYRSQNPILVGLKFNKETLTKDELFKIRSNYPSISATTIPIDIYKANYLLNKKLISDTILDFIDNGLKFNPYSNSGYALKSLYYINTKKIDSAEKYAKIAFYKQSNNKVHFDLYTDLLAAKKDSIGLTTAFSMLKEPIREGFTRKYLKHINYIQGELNDFQKDIIEKYYVESNEFYKAFNIISEVGKESVFKAVIISNEGEKYFIEKEYKKAYEKFEEAMLLNPYEAAYFENAANSLMKLNKNREAIKILEDLINNLNPKTGKAEYLLGILYIDEKKNNQGCDYFNQSVSKGFSIPINILNIFCK